MKQIETTISIAAPADRIWNVLMDFERYSEWNPLIRSIQGTGRPGSRLQNTLQLQDSKPMRFTPKVLKNEPNKHFRWLGSMFVKGLFDGEHYFVLEAQKNGTTVVRHGERFSGVLVGLVWKSIGTKTQQSSEAMNAALKARAES